ncbi:MAG: nucleotidyltransferase domain-containing protein [Deltaproteobacteria bacterium]|nr:nucleotidyltransferase domain-containing protein [Deltaproteobacteria bacterium]
MGKDTPHYGLAPNVVEKIRGVFEQFPAVESVIIYGSRAKGTYRTGSDIDLTIKTDGSETQRLLFDVLEAIDELDLIYLFDVSLFAEIENTDLLGHIDHVGCEFYTHNQGI